MPTELIKGVTGTPIHFLLAWNQIEWGVLHVHSRTMLLPEPIWMISGKVIVIGLTSWIGSNTTTSKIADIRLNCCFIRTSLFM